MDCGCIDEDEEEHRTADLVPRTRQQSVPLVREPLVKPSIMKIVVASMLVALVARTTAFQAWQRSLSTPTKLAARTTDYLSTLSNIQLVYTPVVPVPPPDMPEEMVAFAHANLDYFSIDKLAPKGPRANADVGSPHDASRPLYKGDFRSGSWWCAAGGWPSPKLRTTTEVFFVLRGSGCLTDVDGMRHEFGVGDTVILPKGWSGRWDIYEDIHKVWFVYDHENIEETANPIRIRVTSQRDMLSGMSSSGVRRDALHGSPSTASKTVYDVGPTSVGSWECTPGSFATTKTESEGFFVLEGVFFVTNADGTAQRCGRGDTVVLPKGWKGHWDVIETVRKIWVTVED